MPERYTNQFEVKKNFDRDFGQGGFDMNKRRQARKTIPTETTPQLLSVAQRYGVDTDKIQKENEGPGLFSRVMDIMSRGNYASAGFAKSLVEGKGNPLYEAWKGLKGEEKETYSDVLEAAGVENKIVRGGVGFALDIALDPTTILGGWTSKVARVTLRKTAQGGWKAFKGVTKFNPEIAAKLEESGAALSDAFNAAFRQTARGSVAADGTKLVDVLYRGQNKLAMNAEKVRDVWTEAFEKAGEYGLKEIKDQRNFIEKLINHRRQLPKIEEKIASKFINKFNKEFAGNYKIKNVNQAQRRLQGFKKSYENTISYLEKKRLKIAKKGGGISSDDIDDLREELTQLKKELKVNKTSSKAAKETAEELSDDAVKASVERFIKEEEDRLREAIRELKAKKPIDKTAVVGAVRKTAGSSPDYLEELARIDQRILKETNDLAEKTRQLETVVDARKLAKEQLNKNLPDFTDAERKFFEDIYKPGTDRIADEAGIANKFDVYFPESKIDEVGKLFDPKGIKVGKEGYKKKYGARLADDETRKLLEKPVEVLVRREYEVLRDKLNKQVLDDAVTTFGRPAKAFDDAAEAAKEGFYRVRTKGNLGETVGWMKKADVELINDITTADNKALNMLCKNFGYDKLQNTIKWLYTVPFPAFHMRNMMSGVVQNYEVLGAVAFDPRVLWSGKQVLSGSSKKFKFKNWSGTAAELKNVLEENFKISSRYVADLGNIDKMLKKPGKLSPAQMRKLGQHIEDFQKASAVVGGLKKGMKLDDAVRAAEKAGFDYNKLTSFEKGFMKRIIPFYAFMRKNAALQASTFVNNPERILNQAKAATALSEIFGQDVTEEDLKGLPKWALSGLGFKLEDGQYMTKMGLPLEEFIERINEPLGSTLSSLTPMIKYPLESELGYDFFRKQKINDIDKIDAGLGEKLYALKMNNKLPMWLDDSLNLTRYMGKDGQFRYSASPKTLHVIRNLPTARMVTTLENVLEKDSTRVEKLISFFSGAKIYEIDKIQQEYFRDRDLRRTIENELLKKGVGKESSNFYVYK